MSAVRRFVVGLEQRPSWVVQRTWISGATQASCVQRAKTLRKNFGRVQAEWTTNEQPGSTEWRAAARERALDARRQFMQLTDELAAHLENQLATVEVAVMNTTITTAGQLSHRLQRDIPLGLVAEVAEMSLFFGVPSDHGLILKVAETAELHSVLPAPIVPGPKEMAKTLFHHALLVYCLVRQPSPPGAVVDRLIGRIEALISSLTSAVHEMIVDRDPQKRRRAVRRKFSELVYPVTAARLLSVYHALSIGHGEAFDFAVRVLMHNASDPRIDVPLAVGALRAMAGWERADDLATAFERLARRVVEGGGNPYEIHAASVAALARGHKFRWLDNVVHANARATGIMTPLAQDYGQPYTMTSEGATTDYVRMAQAGLDVTDPVLEDQRTDWAAQ
jgi:hypothetical protein